MLYYVSFILFFFSALLRWNDAGQCLYLQLINGAKRGWKRTAGIARVLADSYAPFYAS